MLRSLTRGLGGFLPLGRRRLLALVLFIHTCVALSVGDSKNASNHKSKKERMGRPHPANPYDSPPYRVASFSPQSLSSYPNPLQREIQKPIRQRVDEGFVRVLRKGAAGLAPTGSCGPGPGRLGRAACRLRTSRRIAATPRSRRSGSGGRRPFHVWPLWARPAPVP